MPKIYKCQLKSIIKSLDIVNNELVKIRQVINNLLNPFRLPDRKTKKLILDMLLLMEIFITTNKVMEMFPLIFTKVAQPLLTTKGKKQVDIDWTLARKVLNDRELKVLELRLAGLTLEKVGEQFELTRERIRQIEKEAINKLGERSNVI